jgi:hypothetical protein
MSEGFVKYGDAQTISINQEAAVLWARCKDELLTARMALQEAQARFEKATMAENEAWQRVEAARHEAPMAAASAPRDLPPGGVRFGR